MVIHPVANSFLTYLFSMQKLLFVLPFFVLLLSFAPNNDPDPRIPADVFTLLNKYSCVSCHALDKKMVGPSWKEIAAKRYSKKKITELVVAPQPANWPGYPPMVAQPSVPKEDLAKIAGWITTVK